MQAACQSPTGTSPTSPIPSAPTIEISLPTDPFPTATLVLQMGLPISQTGEITYLEAPTPVADPLQFIFPTPAPPPVSAWRPPLYPTPWVPTQQDHFYFARPIGANEINWPLPITATEGCSCQMLSIPGSIFPLRSVHQSLRLVQVEWCGLDMVYIKGRKISLIHTDWQLPSDTILVTRGIMCLPYTVISVSRCGQGPTSRSR